MADKIKREMWCEECNDFRDHKVTELERRINENGVEEVKIAARCVGQRFDDPVDGKQRTGCSTVQRHWLDIGNYLSLKQAEYI